MIVNKNIEEQFRFTRKNEIDYNTLQCFSIAITGEEATKEEIRELFDLLVSKQDYKNKHKQEILEGLYSLITIIDR